MRPRSGAAGDGWLCRRRGLGARCGAGTRRAWCVRRGWGWAARRGAGRAAATAGSLGSGGDLPCPGQGSLAAAPGLPHAPRGSQPGCASPPAPCAEGGWDLAASLGRLSSPTAVICSLCSFGLWYQGGSKDPPTSSCSGAWEVIDSLDTQLEPEGAREPVAGSSDRATPPL